MEILGIAELTTWLDVKINFLPKVYGWLFSRLFSDLCVQLAVSLEDGFILKAL
jgi:hypothetical protein